MPSVTTSHTNVWVLKCRFYYLEQVRRQQPLKHSLSYSGPRRGHTSWGDTGKHQCQEAEGVRRQCGQEPLLWFLRGGMDEAG